MGNGRILASGLICEHAGRTATLATSRCHDPEQVRIAADLLTAMVKDLARRNTIMLAQGMIPAEDADAMKAFNLAGFTELAVLACMERPNTRNIPRPKPIAGTEFIQANDDAALQAILRASYEDTLDCPGLAELRSDEDILAGHRRNGRFEPALWTMLRSDQAIVGAALVNRSPENDSVELTYLGLAKSARGKGLGTLLLDEALWKCSQVPERTIALAVDEKNSPADRLYRSRGFRTVARRRAFALRVQSST